MGYMEDKTPFFMDVAKDEKGREAIEYGYESQDDYKRSPLKIQFSKIWLRRFALVRHSKWQIPRVFATFHSCLRLVSLKFS